MELGWEEVRILLIALFSLASIVCFAFAIRSRSRIDHLDTRRGLFSLLILSGLWAAFTTARLIVSHPTLNIIFYMIGLIVGFSTVGAWLYFCSSYSGNTYHRESLYRWAAVVLFFIITLIKITSPIHGVYFTTSTTSEGLLIIDVKALHWIVAGLSYSFAILGLYMISETFRRSNYATSQLTILTVLACTSGILTILKYFDSSSINISYEPIGVAIFAVGVLFFADGKFVSVQKFSREQIIDELSEAIVSVDSDGYIRDVNDSARQLFPSLSEEVGNDLSKVAPEISEHLPVESSKIITLQNDKEKYYSLSTEQLTAGETNIGRTIVFSDVTELEKNREEIEQYRKQRDDFADAITHELRNAVNINKGHIQLAQTKIDSENNKQVYDSLNTAVSVSDRMERIVADLTMVAKYGQPVEETTPTDLSTVAKNSWSETSVSTAELNIISDGTVDADPNRLSQMFEILFTFLLDDGATEIKVEYTDGVIIVRNNGSPLTESESKKAFEYGEAVPDAERGLLLPVVRTLARAHGWNAEIDLGYQEGIAIRIITHK